MLTNVPEPYLSILKFIFSILVGFLVGFIFRLTNYLFTDN